MKKINFWLRPWLSPARSTAARWWISGLGGLWHAKFRGEGGGGDGSSDSVGERA